MHIDLPEKRYYKIGEVAKAFGVNTSLIRFWEKEFEIIRPKKNKKGNRLFTPEDIKNFKLIYNLVKERGFTLDGAKQKLKKNQKTLSPDVTFFSQRGSPDVSTTSLGPVFRPG